MLPPLAVDDNNALDAFLQQVPASNSAPSCALLTAYASRERMTMPGINVFDSDRKMWMTPIPELVREHAHVLILRPTLTRTAK